MGACRDRRRHDPVAQSGLIQTQTTPGLSRASPRQSVETFGYRFPARHPVRVAGQHECADALRDMQMGAFAMRPFDCERLGPALLFRRQSSVADAGAGAFPVELPRVRRGLLEPSATAEAFAQVIGDLATDITAVMTNRYRCAAPRPPFPVRRRASLGRPRRHRQGDAGFTPYGEAGVPEDRNRRFGPRHRNQAADNNRGEWLLHLGTGSRRERHTPRKRMIISPTRKARIPFI
jgi:hypothetical protein